MLLSTSYTARHALRTFGRACLRQHGTQISETPVRFARFQRPVVESICVNPMESVVTLREISEIRPPRGYPKGYTQECTTLRSAMVAT